MNETNQAILLLTTRFGVAKPHGATPLGPVEYGTFAGWLRENDHKPQDLLRHLDDVLTTWTDPRGKITKDRIQALLNRGMAMGVALEKWQGAGLWILTRADSEYPKRLIKQLGQNAPAVLFGAGSQKLLSGGGLAMIGSRDITEADQEYTRQIAKQAANEGLNIVSGSARGVDEIAMRSALEVDGLALGILADGLLKKALSAKWRTYIKNRQLCLVSSFSPDAGWNTGNAMGRNKYIYCLSDYALVVQSTKGKGGTWAGATENLRNHWTNLFVKDDPESPGLEALRRLGAQPIHVPTDTRVGKEWLRRALQPVTQVTEEQPKDTLAELPKQFYERFLDQICLIFADKKKITLAELKERFSDLCQKQIKDWLDKAVEDERLVRPGKARVYSFPEQKNEQFAFNMQSKNKSNL